MGLPAGSWIEELTGELYQSANEASGVEIGSDRYDIISIGYNQFRKLAFYDQWKLTKFFMYRPLIYYSIFDQKFLPMLHLSLMSLQQMGLYKGDVLVISCFGKNIIESFVPVGLSEKLHVWNVETQYTLDIFLTKYRIGEWSRADLYQPLLYVDADVLFDMPVEPLLIQMAMCPKMMGQGEPSHQLAYVPGVGSELFAEANLDVQHEVGFCAGTFAVPNAHEHELSLNVITQGILRYFDARGRQTLGWHDQPAANYFAFRLGGANTDLLYRHVRWGGRAALHGGLKPLGLIHLWGATDKYLEMTELFGMLQGRPAKEQLPWTVYDQGNAHLVLEMPT